jgi:hypothetical protein
MKFFVIILCTIFIVSVMEGSSNRDSDNHLLHVHTHNCHHLMLRIPRSRSPAARPFCGLHHCFLLPLGNITSFRLPCEPINLIHCRAQRRHNSCPGFRLHLGPMRRLHNRLYLDKERDEPRRSSQVFLRRLRHQRKRGRNKPGNRASVGVCLHLFGALDRYEFNYLIYK